MKTSGWAILLLPMVMIDIYSASPAPFENQKWNFDGDRILPSNGKMTLGNIVGDIVSRVSRDMCLQWKMMNLDYDACLTSHDVPHKKVSWIDSRINVRFTLCCKTMAILASHNSANVCPQIFLIICIYQSKINCIKAGEVIRKRRNAEDITVWLVDTNSTDDSVSSTTPAEYLIRMV